MNGLNRIGEIVWKGLNWEKLEKDVWERHVQTKSQNEIYQATSCSEIFCSFLVIQTLLPTIVPMFLVSLDGWKFIFHAKLVMTKLSLSQTHTIYSFIVMPYVAYMSENYDEVVLQIQQFSQQISHILNWLVIINFYVNSYFIIHYSSRHLTWL